MSPRELAMKTFERTLSLYKRELIDAEELGNRVLCDLASTRAFDCVEECIQRLPLPARDAAFQYAREIADERWTAIPRGVGSSPISEQASAQWKAESLIAYKEVARRILAIRFDATE